MKITSAHAEVILEEDQKERAKKVLRLALTSVHWALFLLLIIIPIIALIMHFSVRHIFTMENETVIYPQALSYENFRKALSEAQNANEIRALVDYRRLHIEGKNTKDKIEPMEDQIIFEDYGLREVLPDCFATINSSCIRSMDPPKIFPSGLLVFEFITPFLYILYFLLCVANYILIGKIRFFPWDAR